MSEKFTPRFPPYTAQELIECGWVARARGAVLSGGNAVRIGDCTIEAQNINQPDQFIPIMLPNGGTKLTTLRECAVVLDMLTGAAPIPPPPAAVS